MREKITGRNINGIILGRLSPSSKKGGSGEWNNKINYPLKTRGKAKYPNMLLFVTRILFFPHGELYVDIVMTYISLCKKEVIKNNFFNTWQL